MATHSSILAWRISWTEEPGGLHSVRSQRLRHDRATNANADVTYNAFRVHYVVACVRISSFLRLHNIPL